MIFSKKRTKNRAVVVIGGANAISVAYFEELYVRSFAQNKKKQKNSRARGD